MLQKITLNLKKAFWVMPGFYVIGSVILAYSMMQLDINYASAIQRWVPEQLLTGIGRSEVILGALANSFLTMIFIFTSAVMVVLSAYLGEYSPRTIQNYLSDPLTLHVLGVFSGGFLYSILLLLFLNESDSGQKIMSPAVGVLFAILALALFVYFVHHVGTSIQLSNLIRKLSRDTIASMEDNDQANLERVKREISAEEQMMLAREPVTFSALQPGYIQLIDYDRLAEYAERIGGVIRVEKKVGDYTTDNQVLFSVWVDKPSVISKDELHKWVTVGEERATLQDVEYALQKMVEVTLRGLSPSINDPNTAIFCIHEIGKILNRMARASLFARYYHDRGKQLRLVIQAQNFSDVLYFTFYQIRHYARDDLSVLAALLDSMVMIAEGNDQSVKKLVWDFCSYVLKGFNQQVLLELDQKFIFAKVQHLAHLTGFDDQVQNMWRDYLWQ